MQKFIKICNNTSKYAENMRKSKICQKQTTIVFVILAWFIVFLVSLGH